MIPPHSGPITPPASAEAPISPRARPRRPGGNRSPAMAMDIGSRAPAPTAWNTRAATRLSRSGVRATATEPSMNSAIEIMNSRRWPQTSDRRPISGIATR